MRVINIVFLFMTILAPNLSFGADDDQLAFQDGASTSNPEQDAGDGGGTTELTVMVPKPEAGGEQPGVTTGAVRIVKSSEGSAEQAGSEKLSRRQRLRDYCLGLCIVSTCVGCFQDIKDLVFLGCCSCSHACTDCYEDGECQGCACGCERRRQR